MKLQTPESQRPTTHHKSYEKVVIQRHFKILSKKRENEQKYYT